MSDAQVSMSRGLPETVLAAVDDAWKAELAAARASDRAAVARVAGDHPRYLDAWADLADGAGDPVEGYAYARTGYHRGLDALRQSGWRGTGYVRWRHEENRGFLRCLEALRRRAGEIGEGDEEERCATFLRQLDPAWQSPHP